MSTPSHVVIVGCGRVGSGLASLLTAAGHTVSIIDRKPDAFRRIPEGVEAKRIVGVGFDREVLKEAGVEGAQALAAVTNGDNSNIVVARVAKENFGVPHVLARIYDQRRAAVYERLGIPTVATVPWTIDHFLRRLMPNDEGVVWTDPTSRVVMIERTVPNDLVGRRLSDLELAGTARIAAVARLGAALVPTSDHVAQDGDVIHVIVRADSLGDYDGHLSGLAHTGSH